MNLPNVELNQLSHQFRVHVGRFYSETSKVYMAFGFHLYYWA